MPSAPPRGGEDAPRHSSSRRPRGGGGGRPGGSAAPVPPAVGGGAAAALPSSSSAAHAPGAVADPRRSLLRSTRYQASAQIRKRRREEVLLEKRRGATSRPAAGVPVVAAASGSALHASSSVLTSSAGTTGGQQQQGGTEDAAVRHHLELFLNHDPPSSDRLSDLVEHGDRAVAFLQRWLEREQQRPSGGCDRFLEQLRSMIVASPPAGAPAMVKDEEHGRVLALSLLEALVATAAATTTSFTDDDDGDGYFDYFYYSGTIPVPAGWSHLVARRGDAWVPILAALLPYHPNAVGSILAHLYQDDACAVVTSSLASSSGTVATVRSLLIPQYWPNIVAALSMQGVGVGSVGAGVGTIVHPPEVSRLGSVILQNDATTPALAFLGWDGGGGGNGVVCGLASGVLAELLHDPSTAASAAWMLEGLTRREDAAVEHLCRDAALVGAIAFTLQRHASAAAAASPPPAPLGEDRDASVRILLPTLRTIGNIVTACDGRFLELFDKVLVDCLVVVLSCVPPLREEVLWVMGCCLVDAGRSHHVATTTLAPLWIPRLVAELSEGSRSAAARFEIKRQALASLWIALAMPPGVETFQERTAIQANLDAILLQHVGSGNEVNLVDVLVQLMGVTDHETVLSALRVLQRLVLVVESDRDAFRSRHVLDRLEEVLEQQGASLAGDLASNLLELLQEDDEDDELDSMDEAMRLGPAVSDGSYAFGLPTVVAQDPAASHPAAILHAPTALGRGRGRPTPSWMEERH